MRLTLLRMTQLILSSMDSDEINSIDDTTEAQQVVDQIETTYYDLADTLDFPDQWDFFELEPSSDPTRPTLMSLPQNVAKLEWLKYDVQEDGSTVRNMRTMIPQEREYFFDRMNSLDTDKTDIYNYQLQVGAGTFDIRGHNDRFPTYYTTNNDRTLIFDDYDADINQTLVGNKTMAYGMIYPEFIRDDDFVPDLQPRQFALLFNEAKSSCFIDLKQVQNAKSEQRARKGWVQAHRKSPQTGQVGRQHWDFTYDFGRRGRRSGR